MYNFFSEVLWNIVSKIWLKVVESDLPSFAYAVSAKKLLSTEEFLQDRRYLLAGRASFPLSECVWSPAYPFSTVETRNPRFLLRSVKKPAETLFSTEEGEETQPYPHFSLLPVQLLVGGATQHHLPTSRILTTSHSRIHHSSWIWEPSWSCKVICCIWHISRSGNPGGVFVCAAV